MSSGKRYVGVPVYTIHNKVQLIRGGKDYFELLIRMIDNSTSSVYLQTYIYDEDETGQMVAEAMLRAARRGVQVFLLLDGYASKNISRKFIAELKLAGIQFRWFQPLLHSSHLYFGRRLHHKIIVTDGAYSLIGGLNISNRYNDLPGQPAWLDWAVYSEGEVSSELFYLCQETWNRSGWGKKKNQSIDKAAILKIPNEECFVRVRRDDWVSNKTQISRSFTEMLIKAQSHITIMSSYFLPHRSFKKHLATAARRGVKIKLITAGMSDVPFTKQAERYIYSWLFENNIEIYEYKSGILHGKLSTYDSKWTTVGSFNINNISAYASIELNLDVLDEDFAKEAENKLDAIIQEDCVRILPLEFEHKNNFIKRLWQRTCYNLINAGINLFTFYFRQHPE